MFGDKIYGEPKEAVDNIIEESFERYSQAKEKKGKSAEEQMIDSVSEQLTSVIITCVKPIVCPLQRQELWRSF